MKLIPAIDLLDGKVVRLLHGDFNSSKVYTADPVSLAAGYHAEGAELLHVVDLAASRDGEGADTTPLFNLLRSTRQQVQTGGGVRAESDILARLDHGADRVVIGSLCVTHTHRVVDWLQRLGAERIVAALDVRFDDEGVPWPRIYGWTEMSPVNLWDLLDQLGDGGLRHALVTDISRDGALTGPNTDLYRQITERYPDLQLQASGGISGLQDLDELRDCGAAGAITGKALLERHFTVAQALERLQ